MLPITPWLPTTDLPRPDRMLKYSRGILKPTADANAGGTSLGMTAPAASTDTRASCRQCSSADTQCTTTALRRSNRTERLFRRDVPGFLRTNTLSPPKASHATGYPRTRSSALGVPTVGTSADPAPGPVSPHPGEIIAIQA